MKKQLTISPNTKLLLSTLFLLVLLNTLIWSAVYAFKPGTLEVVMLNVGQGDALFIQTPNRKQILIDGGPDNAVLRELSRVMPFWDRSLDVVILSHGDKDHVAGLPEVLKRFKVEHIIATPYKSETSFYKAFENAREGIQIEAERGQVFMLDEGVTLTILYPDISGISRDINNTSIVARLDYNNTSFLFTGDIEDEVEHYLLTLDTHTLDVDVLKVAHHGSRSSSILPFLAEVTPDYALISAGVDSRFGHPHQETLENLELFTEQILCTCEEGRITIESNGEELWVK